MRPPNRGKPEPEKLCGRIDEFPPKPLWQRTTKGGHPFLAALGEKSFLRDVRVPGDSFKNAPFTFAVRIGVPTHPIEFPAAALLPPDVPARFGALISAEIASKEFF